MTNGEFASPVDAVRHFHRFYTRRIGLLEEHLVRSPFSLTEARVLYEIAQREEPTAAQLARELGLNPGYLSRILRGLQRRELIERRASAQDRRNRLLALTAAGRDAFTELDVAARAQVEGLLAPLDRIEQRRLVGAMRAIEEILGTPPEPRVQYILRPHQPGDLGWVVHRHGVLYNQEYGWDERFEALVAGIVAQFVEEYDPKRERCWIAERDGENVGSVFLVKHPRRPGVARLRLLLVEPKARGLGIGSRLVRECTRFARQAGYRKITLWTSDVLHSARRIYEAEGYRLVREAPHPGFGVPMVAQDWELDLRGRPSS